MGFPAERAKYEHEAENGFKDISKWAKVQSGVEREFPNGMQVEITAQFNPIIKFLDHAYDHCDSQQFNSLKDALDCNWICLRVTSFEFLYQGL